MFYFLSLAAALFATGIYGILSHKSPPGKAISLFSMLNGIVVSLAAFGIYIKGAGPGSKVFLLFALAILTAQFLLGSFLLFRLRTQDKNSNDDSIELLS